MPDLQAFVSAWNSRDPAAVAACYAADGVRVQTAYPPARIEGRDALTEHVGEIMNAWPDCTLETRPEQAAEDHVTLEWVFRGTQSADYGPLPGNGQTVELRGVSVIEMDDEGIREERVYWDGTTLMAAAGLLTE
jgi:steroid delta-isomerase-like uncharacterized protein